jgi:hypothetical protein
MKDTDTIQRRLPKELAYRGTEGIEVWLLWGKVDDRLFVVVHDARHEDSFEFDVDAASALDAFHHPYAHAAFRGMKTELGRVR